MPRIVLIAYDSDGRPIEALSFVAPTGMFKNQRVMCPNEYVDLDVRVHNEHRCATSRDSRSVIARPQNP